MAESCTTVTLVVDIALPGPCLRRSWPSTSGNHSLIAAFEHSFRQHPSVKGPPCSTLIKPHGEPWHSNSSLNSLVDIASTMPLSTPLQLALTLKNPATTKAANGASTVQAGLRTAASETQRHHQTVAATGTPQKINRPSNRSPQPRPSSSSSSSSSKKGKASLSAN